MVRMPDVPRGVQKLQTGALCSGSASAYKSELKAA
jgi:hypothetical protein